MFFFHPLAYICLATTILHSIAGSEPPRTLENDESTTTTVSVSSPINTRETIITEPPFYSKFENNENASISTAVNPILNNISQATTLSSEKSPQDKTISSETSNFETTITNIGTTTKSEFVDVLGSFEKEVTKISSLTSAVHDDTTNPTTADTPKNDTEKLKLSNQIRAVISHYKKFGTVTVPDVPLVPDPMPLPNIKKSFSGMETLFTNQKAYGLSNFTIDHINTDLDKMQVYVAIYMQQLTILGNYSSSFWFKKVAGPFNVTLLYVEASGAAALVYDEHGNLQASESEMDMTFMDSKVNFGNMGILGSLLQGAAASAGPVLFEAVKPTILLEINNKIRNNINKKIKTIGSKYVEAGKTPPVELAIREAQNYIKENGYDPYIIDNYVWKYKPTNLSTFQVNISQLVLAGLSDIRRVGEVSLSMDSGTVQIGLHLATSKLRGKCNWSVSIGKTFERIGYTNFTVEYVQGRGIVNQSLDVSQHPVLEDIDINVGKVKVHFKGTGPLDILLEAIVNTLPDMIRHSIVDAIELPTKIFIQHVLSEIKMEEILEKQLPELDKIGL